MNGLYKNTPLSFFAQAYGCDTYGENAYNTCSTTTTPGSSTPTTGSQLADTGITVGVFIIIAVVLMLLALFVRSKRHKKSQAPKIGESSPDQSSDEHTKQK